MIIKDNIIRASEGFVLTNGEVCTYSATLGAADNIENWYEITEADYQVFLKKQEEEALREAMGYVN